MKDPELYGQDDIDTAFERELHQRLRRVYSPFFEANETADWVMIGSASEEVFGGGTDDQLPSLGAVLTLELEIGQPVHIFGRPSDIGLDGAKIVFDPSTRPFTSHPDTGWPIPRPKGGFLGHSEDC